MVITVHCPACATSFPVDSDKIPERGVKARCSSCGHVFRIERPAQDVPLPPPAAPEPVVDEAPHFGVAAEPDTDEPYEEEGPQEPEAGPSAGEAAAAGESPFQPSTEAAEWETDARDREAPEAGLAASPEVEGAGSEQSRDDTWAEGVPDASTVVSGEEEASGLADDTSDWVFETGPDIDASDLEIERLETVESSTEALDVEDDPYLEGPAGFGMDEVTLEDIDTTPLAGAEADVAGWDAAEPGPGRPDGGLREGAPQDETMGAATPEPEPPSPQATASGMTGFTFGKRDPTEKARRLARVLVSDMIMYNPDRHERALAGGTLKEDFEDEIAKSWREYVEQVGEEMARSNTFWADALNEILARGETVF